MVDLYYENVDALGTAKFFANAQKFEEAKIALDLVKPYCTNPAQINAIAKVYSDIRDFNSCLQLAFRLSNIITNDEDVYTITTNIVRAHLNLNQPLEALKYIAINESRKPNDYSNLMDKALALFLLNRKEEGQIVLRKILKDCNCEEIKSKVRFNLGTYDLTNGNFKKGLKGFLLEGRKLEIWKKYNFPKHMQWEGGIQKGKTILLAAEGGIGDEIINIRFEKHFREVGMNPVWYTNRIDLATVFRRNGFTVITNRDEYQPDWLWCYSMAVPCYLQLEEKDLWSGPYLQPKRMKKSLSGEFKIGLKTMGDPQYEQDLHRTVPYRQILDILPKDATIYSFHIDSDIEDERVVSLRDKIKSWEDTLDYLDQMDIVISSCTSLIHAASAIGKKSIVMVPILNYYVWAYPSKHSSWYSDNTTILRQTEYDNWNKPISELKDYMYEHFPQS